MAEFKRQGSGLVWAGQGAIDHIELYSITGAIDVQLIDSLNSSGIAFLDLSALSGTSRESNRVRYIKTGVYCAMTGAGVGNTKNGILNINVR